MSKLFKLKEWMTVPEAAKHLSGVFGEEVLAADVLRLALDERLTISALFLNGCVARRGKLIPAAEAESRMIQTTFGKRPFYGTPAKRINGDIYVVKLFDEISLLSGSDHPYDLMMVGAEKRHVSNLYQKLIGEPVSTFECPFGAFLNARKDGFCYQLLERRSTATYPELELKLDSFLDDESRMAAAEARLNPTIEDLSIADGFPDDVVLVVRTEVLRAFEQSLNDSPSVATKVSDNTLVSTIAALMAAWPGGRPPSGKDLEKAASSIGVSVSDDSIRKALNLAKEIAPSLKSA